MDARPDSQMVQLAAGTGAQFAHRNALPWAADDNAQDAVVALLVEWPKLVERYGTDVPRPVVATVVRRRLIDNLRKDRRHAARTVAQLPEALPADVNVEAEALDHLTEPRSEYALRRTVSRLVNSCGKHRPATRAAYRRVCFGLARERSQRDIADELGITVARVKQITAELRNPPNPVKVKRPSSALPEAAFGRMGGRKVPLDRWSLF